MQSNVDFHGYLYREVDNAGKRCEQAKQKVFALTAGPDVEPGPDLVEATRNLSEEMGLYINALRRLANFSARRA